MRTRDEGPGVRGGGEDEGYRVRVLVRGEGEGVEEGASTQAYLRRAHAA